MAFSGSQITRLGLSGTTRGLYGSFAGKAAAVGTAAIEIIGVYYRKLLAASKTVY